MEIIFEALLSFVWEVLVQFIGEGLLEMAAHVGSEPFRHEKRRHPGKAAAGLVMLGVIVGSLSVLVLPTRIVGVTGVPGLSLVLSPIANGAVMEAVGRWKQSRGKPRRYLMTWWGAGLFAFSTALIRFLLIEP